ncbi:MAG: hypothetical protein IJ899_15730 [Blautia sp.]|nr:hypothetical protein [Blautia sp.]
MVRKMLYMTEREDGGHTVSTTRPASGKGYKVRWRLIADEGKGITDGERVIRVADVVHRKDCGTWKDCDLPEEEDVKKFMKKELKRAREEAEAMEARMMDKALEGLDIPEGLVFMDPDADTVGTDDEPSPEKEEESDD